MPVCDIRCETLAACMPATLAEACIVTVVGGVVVDMRVLLVSQTQKTHNPLS